MKPISFVVDSWQDDEPEHIVENENDNSGLKNFDKIVKKIMKSDKNSISEQKKAEIKKIFNKYDTKKYGFISTKYVVDIFRLAGQNPDVKTEEKMLTKANQNGVGMIIFPEMISLFSKYWKSSEQMSKELRDALNYFDTDETQIIQIDILRDTLRKYGDIIDEVDMELFLKTLKAGPVNNKDGKILIDDFIKIIDPKEKPNTKNPTGKASKKKAKENQNLEAKDAKEDMATTVNLNEDAKKENESASITKSPKPVSPFKPATPTDTMGAVAKKLTSSKSNKK